MYKKIFVILSLILLLSGCGNRTLESISIEVDKLIPLGEVRSAKITYYPEDIIEDVEWSSSNENVATISNGIIHSKNVGKTTIVAKTTSGIEKKVDIEIYQKIESITLNQKQVDLFVGDNFELLATIKPDNATYKSIIWISDDENIATVEDGLVTAKNTGETTITAITVDERIECHIIVKEKPIEFSGKGDKIISNVNIPFGNYKAIFTNTGRSNFIVKFYENDYDDYGDLLVNEIGAYNGEVVLKDGEISSITGGMLEVKSSGSWTIKIEPIYGSVTNSINGKGDTVTGWFVGSGKRDILNFNNSGSSNFIVRVYDEYGSRDLLVNEIGTYSGQTVLNTSFNTKYYFEIISSGTWSINWD